MFLTHYAFVWHVKLETNEMDCHIFAFLYCPIEGCRWSNDMRKTDIYSYIISVPII